MIKLYMKKIVLIIAAFLISAIMQIITDEAKVVRYLFSLVGLIVLIKLLKQKLKTFIKDLDDYLMK